MLRGDELRCRATMQRSLHRQVEADYARCEGRSIGGIRFDGLFSQSEWREHRCSVIALVEFYIAILGHQALSLRLGYFAKRSVDLASMGSFAARLGIIAAASLHRWTTITLHTGTSSFGGIGFDGVLSRNGRFKPLRSANTPYPSDGTSRVGGQSTLAPDVYQHDVYQHEGRHLIWFSWLITAAILILAGSKHNSSWDTNTIRQSTGRIAVTLAVALLPDSNRP